MYPGIHNYSEIGKLNKVLLHRPGRELEKLTPNNMGRLLFDDIPYLKVAQKEHDEFARILKDNGVEVCYYIDETAKALQNVKVKESFVKEFMEMSKIHEEGRKEAIAQYLLAKTPEDLVEACIAGIYMEELRDYSTNSLADLIESNDVIVCDPMPNLYFTRDPGACVGDGINIHHMSTLTRRRESLLLKYMVKYNHDFALPETPMWYDVRGKHSIEGGDVLVLSRDLVAIGYSERTSLAGIEDFAKNLLTNSGFRKVLVFDIPKCRAFMHLDTVFTMVDYDKFTIHPEIEGPLAVYEVTMGAGGHLQFNSMKEELHKILALELKLPAVELIRCGGDDIIAAQREQWNDGSNTLAIAPGEVVVYARNHVTNRILEDAGVRIHEIPGSELSRGRGGPRCMSMPLLRRS